LFQKESGSNDRMNQIVPLSGHSRLCVRYTLFLTEIANF
jgi:hypothetical protein